MKSKLHLLSLLLLLSFTTNYAQTSASASGIAIQGIARGSDNTALANEIISFTFELYYFNASSIEEEIFSETLNIETDTFGVFSHVIDPSAANNSKFSNNQAYLRIKKGIEIISNEKLKHVPYAISANNGVPTGSIMPFIGTTAPEGWVLCDGGAIPSTATDLIAMVGNNTPDLRAMFLRGTGTNSVNSKSGPVLKNTQDDSNKSHKHAVNLTANSAGSHTHALKLDTGGGGSYGGGAMITASYGSSVSANNIVYSNPSGAHTHTVTGDTGNQGDESRPVSYGVNYIIKL